MKTLGLILLWLGGSGAAMGVAWTGVTFVDDDIIEPAPAALLESEPTLGRQSLPGSTTSVETEATAASSTTTSGVPTSATTTTSTSMATTETTSSPTSQTSPTSPTTVAQGQVLTFNLVGGSTAISFSPGGVEVLWATPKSGYEVRIEQESPGMKVEFRADEHRSRIDAWWSGGPHHDIREEPGG